MEKLEKKFQRNFEFERYSLKRFDARLVTDVDLPLACSSSFCSYIAYSINILVEEKLWKSFEEVEKYFDALLSSRVPKDLNNIL